LSVKAFVVEDNPAIRESLVETLAELADVDTRGVAGNQKDAVAWLTEASNDWDLAIVDLVLELGGNGFGVLKAVQDRQGGRKVVVLTGSASPDVRLQCEALGADNVFDKSIDTEALIDYCRDLGGRGRMQE
jgi:two-component system OmpR family response regulator